MLFESGSQPHPTGVTIRSWTAGGRELVTRIPIKVLIPKGDTFHKFAARAVLGDLERGQGWIHICSSRLRPQLDEEQRAVRQEGEAIGCKWSLVSKWTSFVAIEEPFVANDHDRDPFLDNNNIQTRVNTSELDLLRPRGRAERTPEQLTQPSDAEGAEQSEGDTTDTSSSDPEDLEGGENNSDSDSNDDGPPRGSGGFGGAGGANRNSGSRSAGAGTSGSGAGDTGRHGAGGDTNRHGAGGTGGSGARGVGRRGISSGTTSSSAEGIGASRNNSILPRASETHMVSRNHGGNDSQNASEENKVAAFSSYASPSRPTTEYRVCF